MHTQGTREAVQNKLWSYTPGSVSALILAAQDRRQLESGGPRPTTHRQGEGCRNMLTAPAHRLQQRRLLEPTSEDGARTAKQTHSFASGHLQRRSCTFSHSFSSCQHTPENAQGTLCYLLPSSLPHENGEQTGLLWGSQLGILLSCQTSKVPGPLYAVTTWQESRNSALFPAALVLDPAAGQCRWDQEQTAVLESARSYLA